ncbi:unnamed protein product [Cladocopium goreaui]|uniref:Uncharacterized protein n=1 Tax=Cladocopium goreaui TaxID=2562237 RepID=A0A9P1CEL5_9DINO|nr:unnamed protein product [Cladocopium goreaui]
MFAARGHLALAGFVGYAIGRFGSQETGLAAIDLHSLKTELKVTRLALEETASHTCQAELHSEIRYSSSLRVVLQGCLVLQFALFIWSCCCLRIRRAARATPPVQQEASTPRVLTLDIPDIQVLVHFPDDAVFTWHHRILLRKLTAGVWLCLTPDQEVVRHDLNTQRHVVLDRTSGFPAGLADDVYAFDPISRVALEARKRNAAMQAAVLGEDDPGEAMSYVWIIAEPSRKDYGDTIASELMDDPNTGMAFESKGVQDSDQDVRLLGVHTDKAGHRKLDLAEAVALMTVEKADDFPLPDDVRAAQEFLQAVSEGPGSLHRYHVDWSRLSGINENSSVCHSHRIICEVLRLMISYDQLNVSSLAAAEQLVRWLVQLEVATERNSRAPGFSGLGLILGGPVSAEGRAVTAKFNAQ